jgi:hypothetical protein
MTENVCDLVLDGNAAAGLLEEIFAPEITSAQVECEACGNIAAAAAPHPADSRICARARSCPRSNRAIAIAGRWRQMCRCRGRSLDPSNQTDEAPSAPKVFGRIANLVECLAHPVRGTIANRCPNASRELLAV